MYTHTHFTEGEHAQEARTTPGVFLHGSLSGCILINARSTNPRLDSLPVTLSFFGLLGLPASNTYMHMKIYILIHIYTYILIYIYYMYNIYIHSCNTSVQDMHVSSSSYDMHVSSSSYDIHYQRPRHALHTAPAS
jgi:hypothetical protein